MRQNGRTWWWSAALATIVLAASAAHFAVRPSNRRTWEIGQAVLPQTEFTGSRVTIKNVRNFRYDAAGQPIPAYEDRTYDLDRIESVWLIIAPFERADRGPAHTFLSFGFADSQYVAISIESRRELGEEYSLLKGMLRRYEILYVIGDERDLIGLRTNHRDDDVFVYPIKTSPDRVRRLFQEMLQNANALHDRPEFYNTLFNNCTTRILDHANRVAAQKIRWGREVLLPGYADELAMRLGLLDATGTIEDVRARYLVNQRARQFADAPDFSTRIRSSPSPSP
ncbi:MAG: DUF4105 domain-containing protein [Longimicrobiales bacterium]